jgi:hypothetical protein
MGVPLEIITGPLTIYHAPVGETFTDVDTTPAGNWTMVGTSGADNYSEDGVIIVSNQTIEPWRGLGSTGPVKLFRTEEDLLIRVTVVDMTLEQIALAFDSGSVAVDAGPPAIKTLDLYRGPGEIAQMALLIRGNSPYAAGVDMQFQVPVAVHIGSFEMAFQKAPPAGVLLEFQAQVDPNASSASEKFGQLVAQTA